jgi:type II secretory ATPase GspE/PulE/Tfp pilus assembly ATPase PilB-like protein
MAVQSALTGHLVLSTLHTNDAASAVTRLLDLGIEPYLLASSIIGVLAQRLVRQVCPQCAGPATPAASQVLRQLGAQPLEATTIRCGRGCEHCRHTGLRGRRGIFELLAIDDELRRHIGQRAAASEIRAAAVSAGMKTLRDDGLLKVTAGLTTPQEVLRVTR